MIFALIANASATGQQQITNQISIIGCQFPIQEGVFNQTSGEIDHDREIDTSTGFLTGSTTTVNEDKAGTFFVCTTSLDVGSGQQVPETIVVPKAYSKTCAYVFPCGWFGWIGDSIYILTHKFSALLTLISYFITPINFNILGYTLADISGAGLFLVLSIYSFAYLGIGLFIFNAIRRGIT